MFVILLFLMYYETSAYYYKNRYMYMRFVAARRMRVCSWKFPISSVINLCDYCNFSTNRLVLSQSSDSILFWWFKQWIKWVTSGLFRIWSHSVYSQHGHYYTPQQLRSLRPGAYSQVLSWNATSTADRNLLLQTSSSSFDTFARFSWSNRRWEELCFLHLSWTLTEDEVSCKNEFSSLSPRKLLNKTKDGRPACFTFDYVLRSSKFIGRRQITHALSCNNTDASLVLAILWSQQPQTGRTEDLRTNINFYKSGHSASLSETNNCQKQKCRIKTHYIMYTVSVR